MNLKIIGPRRQIRALRDVMLDEPKKIEAMLHSEVLEHLGFNSVTMPKCAVTMELAEGLILGRTAPRVSSGTVKSSFYIRLSGVTDTLERTGVKMEILNGLVQFMRKFYLMAEYDHRAIQIKPEVLFMSPSSIAEFVDDAGVIIVKL